MGYTLPIPPSTNNLFFNKKGGGRVKSGAYRQWLDAAGWSLKQQKARAVEGPVHIEIRVPASGHNNRDLDNFCKPVLDRIVSLGLIEGDSLKTIRALRVIASIGVKEGNVWVEIYEAF